MHPSHSPIIKQLGEDEESIYEQVYLYSYTHIIHIIIIFLKSSLQIIFSSEATLYLQISVRPYVRQPRLGET